MPRQTLAKDQLVREARGWAADCQWCEEPEDIAALSDEAILRGVERHYTGGLKQFRADVIV
jgi:hypothetical protein